MTRRVPCPPAPGPLEAYAARFDDLFSNLAQRRGFREYLAGLLLPRDRNKTLTCLVGTEPVVGAQHAAVQRLQFFLSESTWDHEKINARRVALLLGDPATRPHPDGVLVIDDSGDRKDGKKTAHVGRQWLGRLGKTDNGIVTVTTCWADENLYYPLHAVPYSPAHHFPKGKSDPGFRTKLRIAAELARTARTAGVTFRAVAADCAYGDQDGFRRDLAEAGLPFVVALKPSHGAWAYGKDAYTPVDAARALTWTDAEDPGDWTRVERTFRDGHTETWWAAEATLGWWGPDGNVRLVVATTEPATLPAQSTWYLATDLPRPGSPREADSPEPAAGLAEVVRIYGIRHWIEQSYKQVKDELGWADFQVRSDTAIRRHQTLVTCAFSFCWDTWFAGPLQESGAEDPEDPPAATSAEPAERGPAQTPSAPTVQLAQGDPRRPGLARPLDQPPTLLASLDQRAPATRTPGPDQPRRRRPRA
ncbi:IS701 family transposase [Streptacidiphilus rugosus]|uniref:IS701 family transposase n=1 Tax=Streptacidiphilus rugosus TaxID=405783 RepID=UPI00068D5C1C|nr:IS701 family transposase [Streptacidiphilus rugosus]